MIEGALIAARDDAGLPTGARVVLTAGRQTGHAGRHQPDHGARDPLRPGHRRPGRRWPGRAKRGARRAARLAGMIDALTDFKQGTRAMWAAGDYARFAPLVAEVGERLVERAGVRPGDAVLDVACGTGNVAIPAARAGARVTGVDLTPEHFPAARSRAAAGRRRRSTGSRATPRRCRSRTTASTSCCPPSAACSPPATPWPPPSWRGCCARAGGSASPRSPTPGRAATSSARSARICRRRRRSPRTRSAGATRRTSARCSPGSSSSFEPASYAERFESLDHAVELYTTTFGPIVALGGAALADELRALFGRHATDGGTRVPYDYLVTLSPRGPAAARRA